MLITFIISLVVSFVVLYSLHAKIARNHGYEFGRSMLTFNSAAQVQGYLDNFIGSSSSNYNYWYKAGIKKALLEFKRKYGHD